MNSNLLTIAVCLKLTNCAFIDFTVSFIIWFTIENYVVIIAASIPSLRPLLLHVKKTVASQGSPYHMNTYGNRSRGTKGYMPHPDEHTLQSSQNRTAVTTSQSRSKFPESSSEEHILPIQNGITKTTEVKVKDNEVDPKDLERN